MNVAILARNRESDLAFKIEMLLPADAELPVEPARRLRDGGIRIATPISVIRQHGLSALQGILNRDAGPLGLNLHYRFLHRPARGIAGRGDHGKERLSQEADVGVD